LRVAAVSIAPSLWSLLELIRSGPDFQFPIASNGFAFSRPVDKLSTENVNWPRPLQRIVGRIFISYIIEFVVLCSLSFHVCSVVVKGLYSPIGADTHQIRSK